MQYLDDMMRIWLDNHTLMQIAKDQIGVECPDYDDLNIIIALWVSSLFQSYQFETEGGMDLDRIKTSLIPHNEAKFVIPSFAFLGNKDSEGYKSEFGLEYDAKQLIYDVCSPSNR